MRKNNVSKNYIKEAIQTKSNLLKNFATNQEILNQLIKVSIVISKAFESHRQVLFCGNGGSAADAQHLSAELTGKFYLDRHPLNSEALHVNTSYITAVSNDYSYSEIYSRLVSAKAQSGDVLVSLSTSGNSENIIRAISTAKNIGVITIGFTGKHPSKMDNLCEFIFKIPSTDTPTIQEITMVMGHLLCDLVEKNLFAK